MFWLGARADGADVRQDLLASYTDVKERPCRKCGRLLDTRAMFPVVRRRIRTKSEAGELETTWEALHEGCA